MVECFQLPLAPPGPVYRPCISASSSSTEAFNVYLVCHDIISWFVTTSNDFAILLRFVTEESSEFPNLFSCKGLERALRLKVDLRFLLALKIDYLAKRFGLSCYSLSYVYKHVDVSVYIVLCDTQWAH